MHSIRRKLSWTLLLGTAALLLVAGLALDFVVRSWLEAEFDRTLEAKARGFVALTEQDGDVVEIDLAPEFMPEFEEDENPEYFQVWAGDGMLARSGSLGGRDLDRDAIRSASPRIVDTILPDGRQGRRIQIDVVPKFEDGIDDDAEGESESAAGTSEQDDDDEEAMGLDPSALPAGSNRIVTTIVIAKGREALDATMTLFGLVLGGVAVALIVAIGMMIRFVVPTGLRPLEEVGRQVERLDAGSLSSRIRSSRETEEIAPLVVTLNRLLDRLEEAFERERRFSSNVAHELRTPVAELRNLAEVGTRWPDDRDAVRRFFDDVREVSESMERTIGNLLALARCDAGIEEIAIDEVPLAPTVDRLCRLLGREAESRGVRIVSEIPPDLVIQTDPTKFELILLNLLSNAVTYSRQGGTIRCVARNGSNSVTVSVANPVENLTAQDLHVMFERFWRKDSARTAGDHSGLGLSLVRALSDLLSFRLDVGLEDQGSDRIFRISLSTLP